MKNLDLDLELRSIQLQTERVLNELSEVHELLGELTPKKEQREFYTVEECARMKGGASLNTYKTNRFLLPGCGNPRYAVYVGGRLCFSQAEVQRWLSVTDAEYLNYAGECGITIIPEKFQRLAQKAKQKIGGSK